MDFDSATIKRNTIVLHVCYYICKQNLNLINNSAKKAASFDLAFSFESSYQLVVIDFCSYIEPPALLSCNMLNRPSLCSKLIFQNSIARTNVCFVC
jgi:hypothetical protein